MVVYKSAFRYSHWSGVHTCFLAQQPSGFQHPTGLQAALDGCFFLLPCVGHLSDQLSAHGIVHWKPDRSSTSTWRRKGIYLVNFRDINYVTYFILQSQLPWLLSSYSNSSSSPTIKRTPKLKSRNYTNAPQKRLLTSSHLLCRRSPAKPSLGLSGRRLPGPRETLLKKGFPRSRLPPERPPQLHGGFMETDGVKEKERTERD